MIRQILYFGARYDDTYPDECTITVIATGLEGPKAGISFSGFNTAQPIQRIKKTDASMKLGQGTSKDLTGLKSKVNVDLGPIKEPKTSVEEKEIKIPEFPKKRKKVINENI